MDNENEKEENQIIENRKLINPLKTMITEDTIVETAEDIIDKDKDIERKKAFKDAEEIISALAPETIRKRKNGRKAKEKEEFDKNLAFTRKNEPLGQKQQEHDKQKIQEKTNKGMERGE